MSDENEQVRGFGHDNTELVNSGDEAEYDAAQASKLKDLDKGDNQGFTMFATCTSQSRPNGKMTVKEAAAIAAKQRKVAMEMA